MQSRAIEIKQSLFRYKVLAISALVLVVILIGNGFTYFALEELHENSKRSEEEIMTRTQALNRLVTALGFGHGIHNFKNMIIRGGSGSQSYLDKFEKDAIGLHKAIADYRALQPSEEELEALDTIAAVFTAYEKAAERVAALHRQQLPITEIDQRVKIKEDAAALERLPILQQFVSAMQNRSITDTRRIINKVNIFSYTMLIINTVLMGTVIVLVYRIVNPLAKMTEVAKRISAGDIDQRVDQHPDDDIGPLAAALDVMIDAQSHRIHAMENLARGNIAVDFKSMSDADPSSKPIATVQQHLRTILAELQKTTTARKQGELKARCRTAGLPGCYEEILVGVNATLDVGAQPS